jgi:prepilin-type N-terminal cleavage/methylation domain-containing protein
MLIVPDMKALSGKAKNSGLSLVEVLVVVVVVVIAVLAAMLLPSGIPHLKMRAIFIWSRWDQAGAEAAERRPIIARGFNRGSMAGVGRAPPGRLKPPPPRRPYQNAFGGKFSLDSGR